MTFYGLNNAYLSNSKQADLALLVNSDDLTASYGSSGSALIGLFNIEALSIIYGFRVIDITLVNAPIVVTAVPSASSSTVPVWQIAAPVGALFVIAVAIFVVIKRRWAFFIYVYSYVGKVSLILDNECLKLRYLRC